MRRFFVALNIFQQNGHEPPDGFLLIGHAARQ